MPKDRRGRSVSFDRSRASPYPCSSSCSKQSLPKNPLENDDNVREWEAARCPVCMEHPHNAILLMCASHEKGCRPFMCDTSYRHSNCFDQFRKSFENVSPTTSQPEEAQEAPTNLESAPVISSEAPTVADWLVERREEGSTSVAVESCDDPLKPKLVCPLCRGDVDGWIVVESARRFMNAKTRSCACEACDFSGTYTDLRKHARQIHPLARPADADPERQRNWRRLEQQRDLGDLVSTLQTSFREDRSEDNNTIGFDEGGWLTVFFLVRILRPGSSSRSSSWSGASRARAQVTIRRRPSRRHWGETYDWDTDARDDENETSDGDSGQRRHLDRAQRLPSPEN